MTIKLENGFTFKLHLGDKCSFSGVVVLNKASLFKCIHCCIVDFSSSDKVFGQLLNVVPPIKTMFIAQRCLRLNLTTYSLQIL